MNIKSAICFLLFFLGFFVASTYRFVALISQPEHSPLSILVLVGIAFGAGIFLAFALSKLSLFPNELWKKLVYGGISGIAVYFALFGLEDVMSQKKLYGSFNEQSFADLKGHCGVYSGRAITHSYLQFVKSIPHLLEDYRTGDRCRMNHFQEAKKRAQLCKTGEDDVQCRLRYMGIFSEKGYWNVSVRKMFLDEMMNLSSDEGGKKVSNVAWAEYLLKDQELISARSSLIRQMGLEEGMSEEFLYMKEAEEYQDLMETKKIIESVTKALPEDAEFEPMDLRNHFAEAVQQGKVQLKRIEEVEHDLQDLKKKVSSDYF